MGSGLNLADCPKKRRVIFIDPGGFLEYQGDLYSQERTVRGYEAYISYLREKYPEIKVSIVSLQGVVSTDKISVEKQYKIPAEIADNFLWISFSNFINKFKVSREYPTVFYSLLNRNTLNLFPTSINVVYLCEFTRKIKYEAALPDSKSGLLRRGRVFLGALREEHSIRKAIANSRGFQANGEAAWNSYKNLNNNGILFYDHRVSELPIKLQNSKKNSFSVAFSGRIAKVKGSAYLADISKKIYDLNPKIKIYLLGDGEDREEVLMGSAPNLEYKGYMSYKEEWEPFVRENVDLMLFPHVQGDPSMTYFEALGQGIPVIGFKNETLSHLVKKGLGWEVKRGDTQAIAELIDYLSKNPNEIKEKSAKALEFMSKNLYPKVVEQRMEHLVATLKSL